MNIASLVEIKKNPKIPDIAPGDTVKVSARIVEGDKERIQVFQGVVLKIKRGGMGANFTVRHVAFGIGVERTFPFNSSLVEKVEIVRQGKVRRSRLFYLRGLSGKEARRKIKRVERKLGQVSEELLQGSPEEVIEPLPETPVGEKQAAVATEAAPAAAKEPETKKPEAPKQASPVAAKEPEATAPTAKKTASIPPAAPPVEEKKETT
jgi:large subunit ribosomal protein L19